MEAAKAIIRWERAIWLSLARIGTAREGLRLLRMRASGNRRLPGSLLWCHFLGTVSTYHRRFDYANDEITFVGSSDASVSDRAFKAAVRTYRLKHLPVTEGTWSRFLSTYAHWQAVAAEKYPNGLPEPESDDPTQWLFHGRPEESTAPLQVAVARLLGYRWPAELDTEMRLSARARALVQCCDELWKFADDDGIVCIPAVRAESPADERLLELLRA